MNIKVELDKLALDELKYDLKQFRQGMKLKVFEALTVLEAAIIQNIRQNAGLNVMSGKLMNSIGRSKRVTIDNQNVVAGEIGPKGVPYAAIHELGGVIKPKNASALTIPLLDNKRADGSPKMSVEEARKKGTLFARDGILFLNKMVLGKGKSNRGQVIRNDLVPLFALKKQVTIPARPYLVPAISQTQDAIMQNFGLFLTASFLKKG